MYDPLQMRDRVQVVFGCGMTDKQLAEIICRALLAIVAALRKRYDLPEYKGVTIEIKDG